MTVSELIKHLQTFPPDLPVVTEGYEEGYDTVKSVSEIMLVENPKKEWYLGKYEKSEDGTGIKAVFLYSATKADDK